MATPIKRERLDTRSDASAAGKKRRLDYNSTTTIEAGTAGETFNVPAFLLPDKSTYFRIKQEANDGATARLLDEDADCVQVFVHWVLTQTIDISTLDVTLRAEDIERYKTPLFYVECYILGEKLGAPKFKNQVLDKIIEMTSYKTPPASLL